MGHVAKLIIPALRNYLSYLTKQPAELSSWDRKKSLQKGKSHLFVDAGYVQFLKLREFSSLK